MKTTIEQPNFAATIGWMPTDALPCPQIGPTGDIVFYPKGTQEELRLSLDKLEKLLGQFSFQLNKPEFKRLTDENYERLSRDLTIALYPDIELKVDKAGLFTPRETLGSFIDGALNTAKNYLTEWVVDPSFIPRTISDRLELNDEVINAEGLLDIVRLIYKPGVVHREPLKVLYSRILRHEIYTLLGLTHEAAFVELDRTQEDELYMEFVDKTTEFIPEVREIWTWIKISPTGEWAKAGIALTEEEVNQQILNEDQGIIDGTEQKPIKTKRNQITDIIKKILRIMEQKATGRESFKINPVRMGKGSLVSADDVDLLVRLYDEMPSALKPKKEMEDQDKEEKYKLLKEKIYQSYREIKRGLYFKIPFKVRPFGTDGQAYAYFYNRPKEVKSEMLKRQRGRIVEDRIAATFVCCNQLTSSRFVEFLRKQFNDLGPDESNLRWIIIREANPSKNPQAKRINTDKYKAIKINFESYLYNLLNSLDRDKVDKSIYSRYMSYKGKKYNDMTIADLKFLFQDYKGISVEVDLHCFTAGGDKQSWLQLEYGPELNHNAMRARQLIESGVMEKLYPESLYGINWTEDLELIIKYANSQALPKEFQFDIDKYLETIIQ